MTFDPPQRKAEGEPGNEAMLSLVPRPGLPRSVRVLIVRRRQTFENVELLRGRRESLGTRLCLASFLASVPGLPRSVRVLIVRRRQTFENRFSNVCRLRTIKTRTERGRPGTVATSFPGLPPQARNVTRNKNC